MFEYVGSTATRSRTISLRVVRSSCTSDSSDSGVAPRAGTPSLVHTCSAASCALGSRKATLVRASQSCAGAWQSASSTSSVLPQVAKSLPMSRSSSGKRARCG